MFRRRIKDKEREGSRWTGEEQAWGNKRELEINGAGQYARLTEPCTWLPQPLLGSYYISLCNNYYLPIITLTFLLTIPCMGTCSVLSPHLRPPADIKPEQPAAARESSATTGAGPQTSEAWGSRCQHQGKTGAKASSWTDWAADARYCLFSMCAHIFHK